MKLIVDISEEAYKRCCVIADLDGSPILKAIKNGTPLDDIKAEIEDFLDTQEQYDAGLRKALEIIDKYTKFDAPSIKNGLPKHYDSHDLIHRETARRIINSPRTKEQMLMVLASAENQKETGHWVYELRKRLINETDDGREYITDYWCKCSECGGDFGFQKMSDAYCKYCGAKMVEPQERSEE